MAKPGLGVLLAASLSAGAAQAADAPFVGQWRLDPARSRLPDQMKIANKGGGAYAFDFAGEVETIKVDGTDQPGEGGTLLSVKQDAPDSWIVQCKQAGRLLLRASWKLSKDGRTLTDHFRGIQPDGAPFNVDYFYRRTGAGTGISGDWRSFKETVISPFSMQVKPFQGDGLSIETSTAHLTKNVKFDGRDYPSEGPDARPGAASSAQRIDARKLVITSKSGGKVTATEDFELSSDLKTLTRTQHIVGQERPNVLVFKRT